MRIIVDLMARIVIIGFMFPTPSMCGSPRRWSLLMRFNDHDLSIRFFHHRETAGH